MNTHFHRSINGIADLQEWSSGNIFPNSYVLGRSTRLFSRIISENSPHSVLNIHLDSYSSIVASSYDSLLDLSTLTDLGSRYGYDHQFTDENLKRIQTWVPYNISLEDIRDYLHNQVLHPTTVSTTHKETALDQALLRELLHYAVKQVDQDFNHQINRISPEFLHQKLSSRANKLQFPFGHFLNIYWKRLSKLMPRYSRERNNSSPLNLFSQ